MTNICCSFKELGGLVWDRMDQASSHGLRWSEETSTETLLLELRNRHRREIYIEAFSKRAEAGNGSDWEWWIQGADGLWHGMRVQAKRAKPREGLFWRLQSYRAKGAPKTQMDTLIHAAAHALPPLTPVYCFYVTENSGLEGSPLEPLVSQSPRPGCLVALAAEVKRTNSSHLSGIAPVSLPWHFLVCPGAQMDEAGSPTLHRFIDLIHARAGSSGPAETHPGDVTFPEGRASPPDYLSGLLERMDREDGAYSSSLGELRQHALEQNLRGFALIRPRSA